MIADAKDDMECARRQAEREQLLLLQRAEAENNYPVEPRIWGMDWETETCFGSFEGRNGKAVAVVGEQLTPVETPGVENVRGTRDVKPETRIAFQGALREEILLLQDRTLEPFPRYVEPVVEGWDMGFDRDDL